MSEPLARMSAVSAAAVDSTAAATRLRILVMTPSMPYPPIWGFGVRVYQLVRHLAARHDVTLLTYGEPREAEAVAVLERLGVRVELVPPPPGEREQKRHAQLTALLLLQSYQARRLDSAAMQSAIDRLLATNSFDIVQVESSQLLTFSLPTTARIVLDEHNIEYELLYRMFREERSVVRKLYNWFEYVRFRREEQRRWSRADACLVTSEREAPIVQAVAPATPTVVVPNGVDCEYFTPNDAPAAPDSIVFTGLMRYRPNVDAVSYFGREILPRIAASRPGVQFAIVGAGPTAEVCQLQGPNVQVTGQVPDVRPYVARAAVAVVPLRMGGGTRLKVVEALAMGKPIVSTSLGCEGIDVRHGEHLLIADDAPAFADAVLRLLADPALATALGRRARALAEEKYGWASITAELERFYLAHLHAPTPRA